MSRSLGSCMFLTVASISVLFRVCVFVARLRFVYKLFILILWLVYCSNLDLLFASCMIIWMLVWCFMISSNRWDVRGDQEEEEKRWRLKLTEGSVFKSSIAGDHPCYLFTFNHLIHIACVYLVANKDILDICYLIPWNLWVTTLGSFC